MTNGSLILVGSVGTAVTDYSKKAPIRVSILCPCPSPSVTTRQTSHNYISNV